MRVELSKAIEALRQEANARIIGATAHTKEQAEERVKELRELADSLHVESQSAILIVFGDSDVESMAKEAGVSKEVAIARAGEWANAIEQTATELCSRQLFDTIRDGQP